MQVEGVQVGGGGGGAGGYRASTGNFSNTGSYSVPPLNAQLVFLLLQFQPKQLILLLSEQVAVLIQELVLEDQDQEYWIKFSFFNNHICWRRRWRSAFRTPGVLKRIRWIRLVVEQVDRANAVVYANPGGGGNTPPVSPPQGQSWWQTANTYPAPVQVLNDILMVEVVEL